jgi:hypothetical protein
MTLAMKEDERADPFDIACCWLRSAEARQCHFPKLIKETRRLGHKLYLLNAQTLLAPSSD